MAAYLLLYCATVADFDYALAYTDSKDWSSRNVLKRGFVERERFPQDFEELLITPRRLDLLLNLKAGYGPDERL